MPDTGYTMVNKMRDKLCMNNRAGVKQMFMPWRSSDGKDENKRSIYYNKCYLNCGSTEKGLLTQFGSLGKFPREGEA